MLAARARAAHGRRGKKGSGSKSRCCAADQAHQILAARRLASIHPLLYRYTLRCHCSVPLPLVPLLAHTHVSISPRQLNHHGSRTSVFIVHNMLGPRSYYCHHSRLVESQFMENLEKSSNCAYPVSSLVSSCDLPLSCVGSQCQRAGAAEEAVHEA